VVDIDGVPVTVVDTAGVRVFPADAIEAEGIARAAAARSVAALIVVVLDGSAALTDDDRVVLEQTASVPRVVVANKSDLPAAWTTLDGNEKLVRVSALEGEGIDSLRSAIVGAIGSTRSDARDLPAVTNLRHIDLLTRAREALDRGASAARAQVPEEFVLADINDARALLEEVTGARSTDDLLGHIFASFCIGK
jgi:tRNA modification GTPase